MIVDAIAKWSEYQGAKQMVPVNNFVPAGKGNKIQPDEPMPIEEISQDMVHRYLSFEDVNIVEEDDLHKNDPCTFSPAAGGRAAVFLCTSGAVWRVGTGNAPA